MPWGKIKYYGITLGIALLAIWLTRNVPVFDRVTAPLKRAA